jgi:plastocyanin
VVAAKGGVAKDSSDVLVYFEPLGEAGTRAQAELRAATTPVSMMHARMIQKNKTFSPHLLAVTVGTVVDFPNLDPIFHNAFSNFEGQIFDLSLYAPGTNKSILFKRPGIVRIFCNIHPTMSAVVAVLDSPYWAITDRHGSYRVTGVPAGRYRMHVFNERATHEALSALETELSIGGTRTVTIPRISVPVANYLPAPHKNKYGQDYPAEINDYGIPK